MFNVNQPSYQRLRSIIAERTNRIVAWIGAGPSAISGLPNWADLKGILCEALLQKTQVADDIDRPSLESRYEQIRKVSDFWLAFQLLRDTLGASTYRAGIRDAFKNAVTCDVPAIYRSVLDLPLSGILNLNLDRLATRAFSFKSPGRQVVEFNGRDASRFVHILKGGSFFIVNLHGSTEDEASWVFTKDELRALLREAGYQTFIDACLCTRTVVFVGVSADDLAVGGHLERLSNQAIDLGDHFWITNRTDSITENWAERTQIQMIHYRSDNSDCSELNEALEGLTTYVSFDDAPPPVKMWACAPNVHLKRPEELKHERSPETLRTQLNAAACAILKEASATAYEDYERFCHEYDEAIYRAWYVTTKPPENNLFGYVLEDEVADGAFGRVFRARAKNGQVVAIKVLKEQVRRKQEMLQSFRRGVRSMRILAQHRLEGMIPYQEASEIPACAVMEFVEGPNLQDAVLAGYCADWNTVLEIAVQLAKTLRRAHLLPERVLHRDLRPPNIMLKDFYSDPDKLTVVVLDFDLSWHMGSSEVSVIQSARSGFLAPEQVERTTGTSTRNAAVDSYGLGMTLYFLRTGTEPLYLQHRHVGWEEDLTAAIVKYPCSTWRSVPRRFARLVFRATKDRQAERYDLGQIEGELELLKEAMILPSRVVSAELVTEELASRIIAAGGYPAYTWDLDRLSASVDLASGMQLRLTADEEHHSTTAYFNWSQRGDRHAKNVKKYLPSAMDAATGSLGSHGWEVLPITRLRSSEAVFALRTHVDRVRSQLDRDAKTIANALSRFEF